jgi:CubicO group peptidase (beta-lactamase class C family)
MTTTNNTNFPQGITSSGFEPVRQAFETLLAGRPGFGAAVAVYFNGEKCVDLWGGSYRSDSVQLVFSATKGMSAVVMNLMAMRQEIDLDAPVASVWPEFAEAGKQNILIRWLLTHQAGLPGVDIPMSMTKVIEGRPMVHALEVQAPMWEPGTAFGYHALTMGFLVGEVVLRTSGRTIGNYFAEEVAAPLGLSSWIGLPYNEMKRVMPIRINDRSNTAFVSDDVILAGNDPNSLYSKAFANPVLQLLEWNDPAVLKAEIPAANGVSDARSLARMYAACIGEVDGIRLLDNEAFNRATTVYADGFDVVCLEPKRFGLGFYLPFPRLPFGGQRAFGHDGAGGTLTFGDPEIGMAFGFTTDLVPELAGADPEAWDLVHVARSCILDR